MNAKHRPARLVLAAVLPGNFEHLHRAAAYDGTLQSPHEHTRKRDESAT